MVQEASKKASVTSLGGHGHGGTGLVVPFWGKMKPWYFVTPQQGCVEKHPPKKKISRRDILLSSQFFIGLIKKPLES